MVQHADGSKPLHVFLVAAEPSGDHLGASLMNALRDRTAVRFSGVGGAQMLAAGLTSLFPTDELHIIGFGEVMKRLPFLFRRIRETVAEAVAASPDVLVIIDSPDFTHRVARRVRAAAPYIPIVDYVCPQVWAWRPWRARAMRRYLDHVLALLPFEPAFLERNGGPPCSFVGHPLAQQIGELRPSEEESARRAAQPPLVLALPGSRSGEIRRMSGVFGEALGLAAKQVGALDVVVPALPRLAWLVEETTSEWAVRPRIVTDPAGRRAAFRSARAALSKSGTVTLELALAGVPTVAAYRVSALEATLARAMISVDSVILANLVLGENVVPELLQEACTPANIASELVPLIQRTPARARQLAAFARLDAIMELQRAEPSARAAEIVLACASARRSVRS
ncbi:MAG: lipid-A-disaccharide synthase [Burkholderiales bacterium]